MSLAVSPAGTVHRFNIEFQRTLCGLQATPTWDVDVVARRVTCRSCVQRHTASGTGFTAEQLDRAARALAAEYSGWTWSHDRWVKIAVIVAEQLAR